MWALLLTDLTNWSGTLRSPLPTREGAWLVGVQRMCAVFRMEGSWVHRPRQRGRLAGQQGQCPQVGGSGPLCDVTVLARLGVILRKYKPGFPATPQLPRCGALSFFLLGGRFLLHQNTVKRSCIESLHSQCSCLRSAVGWCSCEVTLPSWAGLSLGLRGPTDAVKDRAISGQLLGSKRASLPWDAGICSEFSTRA